MRLHIYLAGILVLFSLNGFASTPNSDSTETIKLSYKNADLVNVLVELGKKFHKNFIIDPQVHGRVTITTPNPVSVQEAYDALLSTLAMNGYTPISHGGYIEIYPAQNAERADLPFFKDEVPADIGEEMATVIFHFKNHSAKNTYNNFGPMFGSRLGELRFYEKTNIILMSDYVSNLKRVTKIIQDIEGTPKSEPNKTSEQSAPRPATSIVSLNYLNVDLGTTLLSMGEKLKKT